MSGRPIFKLLWDMVSEIKQDERSGRVKSSTGTIISNYAGVIDDRIENSGYSRSTKSLKLYTTEQLKEELEGRSEDE